MDRDTSRRIESGRGRAEGPVLPSRREALDRLIPAIRRGPVLISGEPGVGKTWLARILAEEAGADLAWVEVDVSPSDQPADFFHRVASGLGLEAKGDRASIGLALAESSKDGRAVGLRVDEAQNASAELLEEIRILDNRLGLADGFAAIVLVSQTALVRRLGLRNLGGFETRLAAHAHLLSFDVEESELLLGGDSLDVETLHRSALGNPARLLRLSMALNPAGVGSTESRTSASRPSTIAGPILPSRPPLRVEDGVIEVGWDSDSELASSSSGLIHDPAHEDAPIEDDDGEESSLEHASNDEAADLDEFPSYRAEGQHDFAPYSQLFARARQTGEKEKE